MTTAQKSLYWREWSRAKKAGGLEEEDRHRLHAQALGSDKSSKLFTDPDFDKILALFRAYSRPADLNGQVRQIEQPRTRLLHRIHHQFACLALFLQAPCNYVAKILQHRFHVEQLEDLKTLSLSSSSAVKPEIPWDDLVHLRNTLARCLSRFRQNYLLALSEGRDPNVPAHSPLSKYSAHDLTEHDLCALARVPCFRPACAQCRTNAECARGNRREKVPTPCSADILSATPASQNDPF